MKDIDSMQEKEEDRLAKFKHFSFHPLQQLDLFNVLITPFAISALALLKALGLFDLKTYPVAGA